MASGDGVRSNWRLALAGVQAGVAGALILLGYLALDSKWHSRSVWTVSNLLASTFYGESAYHPGFGAGTSAGVSLVVFIYGLLGALFGLVVRDHFSRARLTLLGLIYGTGWFFLSFDVLWNFVNPMVRLYSPDRAMLVGHVLYGGALGWNFPGYFKSVDQAGEPEVLPPG